MAEAIVRLTYGDVIRRYSDLVERGHADADLNPRQRRLVVVMLNLASNGATWQSYASLREEDRDAAIQRLGNILWDAHCLVVAASPRSDEDLNVARERAVAILRGC